MGDTTINNYCTGIRSINSSYKQKYLTYRKKYNKDKYILVDTIINLLTIIEGTIYAFNSTIDSLNAINNNENLKNICLKLYNISKNDKDVTDNFSNKLNKLISENNLYEAIINILFFIILDKKQPLYEEDIKKNIIENLLSNTNISPIELESYLNLKFTNGINYNYSLNKLAKEENTYALYEMGINEYSGYIKGYPRYDISYNYFKKASIKDHPGSYYMMGSMYMDGLIGSRSNEELNIAFNYLNKAVNLGNIVAINKIGLFYMNGLYPVEKNIDKAILFFKKAAEQEYPYAYNNLGMICEKNNNMQKAFTYYEKSASLGESWALNRIGEFYRKGIYVKKDMEKAFNYYNKAIDIPISNVCYYAFYNLAKYYYLTGNTILIKDENKAIEYLNIAKNNVFEAQTLLLYLYTNKYLKNHNIEIYNKIKELISLIENNPKYNNSIKLEIENNLQKIKEDNHINIDILN